MTTYSLYSGSGPALTSYSGPFQSGIGFEVTQGGMWFNAFRWWVPAGGDTAAQKFALWVLTASTTGVVVSGSVVTSGTLTAGAWNVVPLATPVQLSIGVPYRAATGWTAVSGFPVTNDQFGSGDPFAAGITSGPLFAYSDSSGSASDPYGSAQGTFSDTSGQTDPSLYLPAGESSTANFGMDVVVSTTAPGGFTGPFSLWPNNVTGNSSVVADTAANYNVGTQVNLSQACTCSAIRYLSPSGCTDLATEAGIWKITGSLALTQVASIPSPSWSGAAGSGFLQASFANPPVLQPGDYVVAVYDGNSTPAAFNAKDSETNYWAAGAGASGIATGPLTAPAVSAAALCWAYDNAGSGNVPPFTDGSTQLKGQAPFGQLPTAGAGPGQPYLYAAPSQNYFVDGLFSLYAAPAPQQPPFLYVQRRT